MAIAAFFFGIESDWPPRGSWVEPPCKNDPRHGRFSGGVHTLSPDRRTAAGKKRTLSFKEPHEEPGSPPPYTIDDHMLNKYMNDSP